MGGNFDLLYGPCLPAGKSIEPLELQRAPHSLQLLDDRGFKGLGEYFRSAVNLRIPNVIHQQMTILWVMDEATDVYVAFEELIEAKTGEYLMPYFRSNAIVRLVGKEIEERKIGRLGHPSLLRGSRTARIAGEIVSRPNDGDEHLWKVNRASGRYGLRPHQTDEHLKAVHTLFTNNGLHVGLE